MKLNDKGIALYKVWEKKYYDELDRLKKELNDPNYEEGWCILETKGIEKTIEDSVGIEVFGDDDNAIYHVLDCNFRDDEAWAFGVNWKDFVKMLLPYYDYDEEDRKELAKHGIYDGNPYSFLSDDEKMHDFFILNKREFLESYSYLTEAEYEKTVEDILNHINNREVE